MWLFLFCYAKRDILIQIGVFTQQTLTMSLEEVILLAGGNQNQSLALTMFV